MDPEDNFEEDCNEIDSILSENEQIDVPAVGMIFNSQEEVYSYYLKYAKATGFGISTRSSLTGERGFCVVECSQAEKSRVKGVNHHGQSATSSMCASNQLGVSNAPNFVDGNSNTSNQSCKLLSPVKSHPVGRPQEKRKESVADQKIKKSRARKNKEKEVINSGCEQIPPISDPSSIVNEIGTQKSVHMGNLQLLQKFSQGVYNQFWSGGNQEAYNQFWSGGMQGAYNQFWSGGNQGAYNHGASKDR